MYVARLPRIYSTDSLDRPRTLELTSMHELVAQEYNGILKKNGFELNFTDDAPVGSRVKLMASPMSKDPMYDVSGGPCSSRL